MFSHVLTPFLSTAAAPWSSLCWQPTENLIKSQSFHASSSVYLFIVKCHLADSTLNATVHVQRHGEEVLQRDFPTDAFSLTYLCPIAWSCYMFINIITTVITIGLGTLALQTSTRAMWCICQHGFSWLFSSSLAQRMTVTYCDNRNRY